MLTCRYDSYLCTHGKAGKTQKDFGKSVSQLHKRLAKQMPKEMFECDAEHLKRTIKAQGAKDVSDIMKGFHADVRCVVAPLRISLLLIPNCAI